MENKSGLLLLALAWLSGLMALGQDEILKNADMKKLNADGRPIEWRLRDETVVAPGGGDGADFILYGKNGNEAFPPGCCNREPSTER